MASGIATRQKNRQKALYSTSATRYKATLHNGAARPTVATDVYAAAGLGELATSSGNTYVAGGAGLANGIPLNSTLGAAALVFDDVVLTTDPGETVGPFDTVCIWDTEDNDGLVGVIDIVATPQTAGNGGDLTIDMAAATLSFEYEVA